MRRNLAEPSTVREAACALVKPKMPDSREPYVDADQAAAFLGTNRLKVIRMARCGFLPAHPLGGGKRRQWRFKLSELDKYMQGGLNGPHPPVRQSKGE